MGIVKSILDNRKYFILFITLNVAKNMKHYNIIVANNGVFV